LKRGKFRISEIFANEVIMFAVPNPLHNGLGEFTLALAAMSGLGSRHLSPFSLSVITGARHSVFVRLTFADHLRNTQLDMFSILSKKTLSEYNPKLSRQELIRRARLLIIDDEKPQLIDDLKKDGFSVDYDAAGNDTAKIEKNLYDLIILDFGEVGKNFGKDHGLSLLKHIKRVNPAAFVLAYTSKSLAAC
jgi:CheY-like chemotaxis protein